MAITRTARAESNMSPRNGGFAIPPPKPLPAARNIRAELNVSPRNFGLARDPQTGTISLARAPEPQSTAVNHVLQGESNMSAHNYGLDLGTMAMKVLAERNNPFANPAINGAPAGTSFNASGVSRSGPVGITAATPASVQAPNEAVGINPTVAPPPPTQPAITAPGDSGGTGTGVNAEGRGGIYGNLFQNTNRRNPRNSLSMTSDQLRKSAASRLGL